MFEVLTFVYQNYYADESYPEPAHLQRKLRAVGFEDDEIGDAIAWLNGLNAAACGVAQRRGESSVPATVEPWLRQPQPTSVRIYPNYEQSHLGSQCLGFIRFLESAGVLSPQLREIVIDRALAAPGAPLALDDFKVIILMVFWSVGLEPDALVLDELCDDPQDRVAH
jgi:Smg protein